MITINLLPEDLKENISFSRKNKTTLRYLKVVVLLCLFALVAFLICGASLLNSNRFFLKEIDESSTVIDNYRPIVEEKKKIEDKAKSIDKIRLGYKYFTKFDLYLEKNTPEGIYLSTVETQNDTLKISGYAKVKNDIGLFRDALEDTDAFSNVNIDSIKETDDPVKQGTTVNIFTMNTKLENGATSKGVVK